MTLTGTGSGLNIKGADQFQFAYLTRPAGDFEVVVRLTSFSGTGTAAAGIMARASNSPDGPMTTLFYKAQNNSLNWISRLAPATAGAPPPTFNSAIGLAVSPVPVGGDISAPAAPQSPAAFQPLWLKIVRIGHNFAVYKSRDGRLWPLVSNVSGGPIGLYGPPELGLFVSSDADGKPVTATFDSIRVGETRLGYRTSWVGNTFGCRYEDSHVSNGLSALWVAPDGTCYASSYYDEAGEAVKAYRDGKVLRALPVGNPQTNEGGITGDAHHIFVAVRDRIMMLDPAADNFAPQPLDFSVDLFDAKTNSCAVSGMASNGQELFVADARDKMVRVATLDPVKTFQVATAANDGIRLAPAPVAVPADDPRFAPAAVYQSQRVGEGFRYTFPGLVPGAAYTVRCHLAEYSDRPPAHRTMQAGATALNVFDLAGGLLKAVVHDLPGYKADAQGNLAFDFSGGYGGGLCGLEVLDAKGARVVAINCGGPPVDGFQGESADLVGRAFPFERPGPMTIDKRGDLWIIQLGNDFPVGGITSAKYPAAIRCFHPDGTFAGRQITDVVNPRGLGYDAARDQLVVADNGPSLQVRFYGGLETVPVLDHAFGEKGGIFGGQHPGLVNDPAAGGYARFAGLAGVGVDTEGRLYVGGGIQGTDLRMFGRDASFGWMLNSQLFCNTYDFDPDSDGTQLYSTYSHDRLDLTKTAPGSEQSYVGYNWNLPRFGLPDRAGNSQSIVRRLGPARSLFMFTSSQGLVAEIKIFRYEGEIAIPAGEIRAGEIWCDSDGDGKEEPGEVTKMDTPIGWVTALSIDSKGGIWAGVPGMGGSWMRHFFFQGCNAHGVPVYSAVKGTGYEDITVPGVGGTTRAWSMSCRLDYDAARDIMVVFSPSVPRTGETDKTPPQYMMGRYDNWSKGNRNPTWLVRSFTPYTDPQYFMYETSLYPYSGYEGMQVVGNYVFMAYLFGDVHVFDLQTGKLVQILAPGPEASGGDAWEDAAMGLRAFQTKAGEYLVLTENSGWGGKDNFFRWKPGKA